MPRDYLRGPGIPRGTLDTNVPTTRKQRAVNYGQAATVLANASASLLDISKEQADELLVTLECVAFGGIPADVGGFPSKLADFRPVVRLEWGHGGATVSSDYDITYRQRIPIVASTVKATLRIAALPFPGANLAVGPPAGDAGATNIEPVPALGVIPAAAFAKARAFVGEGVDGMPLSPTMWLTQLAAAAGVFAVGQCRLATFRAFTADPGGEGGPTFCWLLLFDSGALPVANQIPFDAIPFPAISNAVNSSDLRNLPMGQTRGFVNGLSWGLSTNPYKFVALGPGTTAFVVAELLT